MNTSVPLPDFLIDIKDLDNQCSPTCSKRTSSERLSEAQKKAEQER
jgi:hypothetical protein